MARNQKSNTENQILEAAEVVFIRDGYDGARTTEIARQAGITHAMLHYYFSTKEELYQKIFQRKMEDFIKSFLSIFDNESSSIVDTIELGMRLHFDFLKTNKSLPLFLMSSLRRSSDTFKDIFLAAFKDVGCVLSPFQQRLDAAAASGEIRPVSAALLMMDIVMLNVSAILFDPAYNIIVEIMPMPQQDFLQLRLEENINLIKQRLRV